jgi:hypothetical protein
MLLSDKEYLQLSQALLSLTQTYSIRAAKYEKNNPTGRGY